MSVWPLVEEPIIVYDGRAKSRDQLASIDITILS